jgi:para-aminobenzoate synthetase / 4-amino-4-deoxychorismate lyase
VFLNKRGELTEGSFTTVFAEIAGRLLTPALSCSLLPGTLRAEMLETGQAAEAKCPLSDLLADDAANDGEVALGTK